MGHAKLKYNSSTAQLLGPWQTSKLETKQKGFANLSLSLLIRLSGIAPFWKGKTTVMSNGLRSGLTPCVTLVKSLQVFWIHPWLLLRIHDMAPGKTDVWSSSLETHDTWGWNSVQLCCWRVGSAQGPEVIASRTSEDVVLRGFSLLPGRPVDIHHYHLLASTVGLANFGLWNSKSTKINALLSYVAYFRYFTIVRRCLVENGYWSTRL